MRATSVFKSSTVKMRSYFLKLKAKLAAQRAYRIKLQKLAKARLDLHIRTFHKNAVAINHWKSTNLNATHQVYTKNRLENKRWFVKALRSVTLRYEKHRRERVLRHVTSLRKLREIYERDVKRVTIAKDKSLEAYRKILAAAQAAYNLNTRRTVFRWRLTLKALRKTYEETHKRLVAAHEKELKRLIEIRNNNHAAVRKTHSIRTRLNEERRKRDLERIEKTAEERHRLNVSLRNKAQSAYHSFTTHNNKIHKQIVSRLNSTHRIVEHSSKILNHHTNVEYVGGNHGVLGGAIKTRLFHKNLVMIAGHRVREVENSSEVHKESEAIKHTIAVKHKFSKELKMERERLSINRHVLHFHRREITILIPRLIPDTNKYVVRMFGWKVIIVLRGGYNILNIWKDGKFLGIRKYKYSGLVKLRLTKGHFSVIAGSKIYLVNILDYIRRKVIATGGYVRYNQVYQRNNLEVRIMKIKRGSKLLLVIKLYNKGLLKKTIEKKGTWKYDLDELFKLLASL